MKRLLAIALLLAACDKRPATPPDKAEPVAKAAATEVDPCSKAHPEGGEQMPWIADDLPAALACGAARKLPVVVDLWAPWCHTCLSMKSTVFTDPSFKPEADKFVFVALDTDKEVNAAAVGKYPPSAWPTFYVIGPDKASGQPETVLARFVGAASVAQFHTFLDAGRKAQDGGAAGADARLLGSERAIAVKDLATAEQELDAALGQAPADWPRRPEALRALISTKSKRKDLAGCVALAGARMDDTGNAAAATDFLVIGLHCADKLEKDDPAAADKIKALRAQAATRLAKLADDPAAAMSIDDRSDALATLREAQDALGRHDDAKATALRQRALLDDAAAKTTTPMAAMTYNWQRAEVYAYLGVPLEIVPALEKSAKDLPTEYDPRARLGWVYLKADKLPEAAKWTDEALALVYGPRKARLIAQRTEIAVKQHDAATERKMRGELVALWQNMPAGQADPEALDKAKQELAALEAPAPVAGK
ncbi:MAG TPA: thioredoxin family protein [Kofleriaceae bacterium]|nr:thioredoxin family protein [Kofleriaceae bacterium]